MLGVKWGPHEARHRTSAANWRKPLSWNREAARLGVRYRVFCASLADVFDNEVPAQWRHDLFALIDTTPHLDWLLLTKRIGNVRNMMFEARGGFLPLLPHVWIGATICNQAEADRDIPKLLKVPAAKRFLSIEPMLGPIRLDKPNPVPARFDEHGRGIEWIEEATFLWRGGVDWVIVGGESGPDARPIHPDWARSLRDQCAAASVPFLFKQWGNWIDADQDECPCGPPFSDWMWADGSVFEPGDGQRGMPLFRRVGKALAGRILDGVEHNGYPEAA
jgi:protein gp37